MSIFKRSPAVRRQMLGRDEFERLAVLLTESSSRLEDLPYEHRLEELCIEALDAGDDTEIEAALSAMKNDRGPAYDQLLATAEDAAQTIVSERGCAVLLLIPILAWSRYRNYCGELDGATIEELAACLRETLAPNAQSIVMGNVVISADHIPEALSEVRRVLSDMTSEASRAEEACDLRRLITKDPPADFADTRYLVCAVIADAPVNLFRSPEDTEIERARAQMDFCLTAREILEMTMIGSVFEVQPPAAFFSAWRQAESAMHVWSVKSLVDFITTMGYDPGEVVATIGLFVPGAKSNPDDMSEIRIGISPRRAQDKVIAGVAWSIVADEFEQVEGLAHDVLAGKGVSHVVTHPQTFPLEWCEDCGSPFYATPDGMVVHIEVPEDDNKTPFPPTLN